MNAIEEQFGEGKSLYEVLDISPTTDAANIKKAYYKAALKYHPDKCPGDEAANARFQALSMVHAILSDPERRSLYDETGEVTEDGNAESAEDDDIWYDYWRALFPKVTEAAINSFDEKYKGSEEETRDVLEAYKRVKGKMSAVTDSIMLATDADEDRFRGLIEAAIERKDVPTFAAFRKKTAKKAAAKRKAKMDKEAAEAEELMAMIKARNKERSDAGSLSTHRSKQFDKMVSSLEGRYGGGGGCSARSSSNKRDAKSTKKAPSHSDIDDDEFDRVQKQLEERRTKRVKR